MLSYVVVCGTLLEYIRSRKSNKKILESPKSVIFKAENLLNE